MTKITLGVLLLAGYASGFAATNLSHMSLQQLNTYDGKSGHKAYVALNGNVYDVSNINEWKGGKHYKGMVAGTDVSPYINLSPHGPDIVNKLKLHPIALYP